MLLNREEFLTALESVIPAVATNSIILGADRIAFYKNRIYTTNGIVSMSRKFEFPEQIECAVRAAELYIVVSRMTTDEIDLSHVKDKLVIKAGKAKASIGVYEIQKNSSLYLQTPTYIDLPSDYYDAISYCVIPKNKCPLAGVYVSGNAAMSTDGGRINYVLLSKDSDTFWINDSSAKILLKAGNIFTEYAVESSEVWFNSEYLTIAIKRLQDESYQSKAIKEYYELCKDEGGALPIPPMLSAAINRSAPFIEKENMINPITLFVSSAGVEITSNNDDGSYVEIAEFDELQVMEASTVRIDSGALAQAMKNCDRFKVRSFERNGYTYTMLVLFGHNSVVMLNTLRGTEQ